MASSRKSNEIQKVITAEINKKCTEFKIPKAVANAKIAEYQARDLWKYLCRQDGEAAMKKAIHNFFVDFLKGLEVK